MKGTQSCHLICLKHFVLDQTCFQDVDLVQTCRIWLIMKTEAEQHNVTLTHSSDTEDKDMGWVKEGLMNKTTASHTESQPPGCWTWASVYRVSPLFRTSCAQEIVRVAIGLKDAKYRAGQPPLSQNHHTTVPRALESCDPSAQVGFILPPSFSGWGWDSV